jgi:anti-sigma factor RsiW
MIDEKAMEDLVAYMDGELDAEEREAVDRRLRDDPEYAAELASLREADALLDLYAAPEPTAGLTNRIVARAGSAGLRGRLFRLRPVLAAAALLLIAGVLVLLQNDGTTPIVAPSASETELAIENLHVLEYMDLMDEAGQDVDDLIEDAPFLDDAPAILAMADEDPEPR